MPALLHAFRRAFTLAFAGGAALVLAGCVSGEEVTTRFWLLSPLPPSTAALEPPRDPALALDIAALRLPQYLQRPQIVTRSTDNQVVLAEYEQWGGNLAKNMMRVLAQNLSRLLSTPEVTLFSRRPSRTSDLRIEIEVLQFERGPTGKVLLSVQWRLRRGEDGAPMLVRITEIESPPIPAESPMANTVAAMSTLWGEFGTTVAETIRDVADRPAS